MRFRSLSILSFLLASKCLLVLGKRTTASSSNRLAVHEELVTDRILKGTVYEEPVSNGTLNAASEHGSLAISHSSHRPNRTLDETAYEEPASNHTLNAGSELGPLAFFHSSHPSNLTLNAPVYEEPVSNRTVNAASDFGPLKISHSSHPQNRPLNATVYEEPVSNRTVVKATSESTSELAQSRIPNRSSSLVVLDQLHDVTDIVNDSRQAPSGQGDFTASRYASKRFTLHQADTRASPYTRQAQVRPTEMQAHLSTPARKGQEDNDHPYARSNGQLGLQWPYETVDQLKSRMADLIPHVVPQSLMQRSETRQGSRDMVECLAKIVLFSAGALLFICSICGLKKARNAAQNTNIREYCGIGAFLRWIGYDKYDSFGLSLMVSKDQYLNPIEVAIRISAGGSSVTTASAAGGSQGIRQTLNIEVSQGTRYLLVEMVDPNKKSASAVLASKKLPVDQVLDFADAGKMETITLKVKNKKIQMDPRVQLTFCALGVADEEDGSDDVLSDVDEKALSPEMQMLLKQSNAKKMPRKKTIGRKADKQKSSEEEKGTEEESSEREAKSNPLDVLGGTCKGNLLMSSTFGSQKVYFFSVYQCAKDGVPRRFPPSSKHFLASWHLGWWKEGHLMKKQPPEDTIPMLRITNVHACAETANDFCVRYVSSDKARESMYLAANKADFRSREVWVESLHLFLEQLHKKHKEAHS